jgi:excisionase family DNA binding protein
MDDPDPDRLLTTPEAAELLRLSVRTMERRCSDGTGPRYVALGRAIRYKRADLISWIDRAGRYSTSEAAQ